MTQPNLHRHVRLLGLSGSIRKNSTNTAILTTLADAIKDKAVMSVFKLNEIPLYNADYEDAARPATVIALRDAIEASDGIVVCSPEYNHGIPGVLKNALDWASRPAFESPLKAKPTLIMTSSHLHTGGARAQHQIRETLSAALCRVVSRSEVVIADSNHKVKDDRLVDDAALRFALEAIDDLLQEIRLVGQDSR